jgi:hypothetical protein
MPSLIFWRLAVIIICALSLLIALPRAGFTVFEADVLTALVTIVLTLLNIMRDVARFVEKK